MSGLTGLHHVAIIASDYGRSKAFYIEALGFTILREVWRAERRSWKCDLTIDGAQIELFTFPEAPPRPSRPEALGLRHLAFTVADIDAEVARLATHGIACEPIRIDEHTGQRFTFFADPDGLPLELYETRRAYCCMLAAAGKARHPERHDSSPAPRARLPLRHFPGLCLLGIRP